MANDLGNARLEAFSDAVFALAATLLVVTLEVPSDYDELLEALSRFPAFGLAFAALISLWVGHRALFARYPMGDGWTVAINSMLLFVVLLYVYPLKLLAEVLAGQLLPISTSEVAEMDTLEIRGLYLIFGAAVVATSVAMAGLYGRAWQRSAEWGQGIEERRHISASGLSYLAVALVGLGAMGVAAVDVGNSWGLPIWLLIFASPSFELLRRFHRTNRGR